MDEWIERDAALAVLGVKAQTLYAYVSRGRIEVRRAGHGTRRSLYRAEDVARLASMPTPAASRPTSPPIRWPGARPHW